MDWKSFDERIIDFTYTIQVHLFEIAVCSLIMLIGYPQSLTNADILGQGNLNLVREKSGKSQGILLNIICGNPSRKNIANFLFFITAVMMAARSLIVLYRKVNPELLHRKDKVSSFLSLCNIAFPWLASGFMHH